MTYQAASGGGAQHMRELLTQFGEINQAVKPLLDDPASAILEIDRGVLAKQQDPALPHEHFGVPLGGNLIPWIDKDLGNGMSKEEEGRGRDQQDPGPRRAFGTPATPIDGLCVRIGAMRCHSQALTIAQARPADRRDRIADRSGHAVGQGRSQHQGRHRPSADPGGRDRHAGHPGAACASCRWARSTWAPSPGDQLRGAAEPLRRMLRIALAEASILLRAARAAGQGRPDTRAPAGLCARARCDKALPGQRRRAFQVCETRGIHYTFPMY